MFHEISKRNGKLREKSLARENIPRVNDVGINDTRALLVNVNAAKMSSRTLTFFEWYGVYLEKLV